MPGRNWPSQACRADRSPKDAIHGRIGQPVLVSPGTRWELVARTALTGGRGRVATLQHAQVAAGGQPVARRPVEEALRGQAGECSPCTVPWRCRVRPEWRRPVDGDPRTVAGAISTLSAAGPHRPAAFSVVGGYWRLPPRVHRRLERRQRVAGRWCGPGLTGSQSWSARCRKSSSTSRVGTMPLPAPGAQHRHHVADDQASQRHTQPICPGAPSLRREISRTVTSGRSGTRRRARRSPAR